MEPSKYIRFDWAIKRLLRQKANFVVLEGFLSVLIGEKIRIIEILESESNQETADDKYNRVDIKARDSKDEIVIIEVQNTRELAFMERILYGVSKAVTEQIHIGESFKMIKKVYSISILYFNIGEGADYLYYGQTSFIGVHTGDHLRVTAKEHDALVLKSTEEIFPEYYLIRVNDFDKVAVTPLDEWINYLKTGDIPADATAPGLPEARERMLYYNMSPQEQHAYREHLINIAILNDFVDDYELEIAIEKQRADNAEQRADNAEKKAEEEKQRANTYILRMKQQGYPIEKLMEITGLSREEIERL
jgi:predicted transposase/invertase (TIGR01784 family)